MSDEAEVMEALEEHTKTVGEQLAAAMKKLETVETQFKADRGEREALERKINLLSMRSAGASADDIEKKLAEFNLQLKVDAVLRNQPAPPDIDLDTFVAYKSGLNKCLRSGSPVLTDDERKAMTVSIDSEGGYLTTPGISGLVERYERLNSPISAICRHQPTSLGSFPTLVTLTGASSGWVGETQPRDDTAAPKLGVHDVVVHEIYAQPKVSQKLLDDAVFDVEAWLGEEVGVEFGAKEDIAFISGNGTSQPRGFTNYPTAATADATRPVDTLQHIPTGVAGNWPATNDALYDLLVDVVYSLKAAYRQAARWVFNTAGLQRVRKVKDSQNMPIWQPAMQEGQPSLLLGYPVTEAENMPAIAANSLSVAFGNFQRGYLVPDRMGVRVLRDPYTQKGYVKFYTTKRLGGGVLNTQAIKLIRFATT